MKKKIILLFLIIGTICIANASAIAKRYYFANSSMFIQLDYKTQPKVFIKYIKDNNMLYVEFYDTQADSKNVQSMVNNGTFIKKVDVLNNVDGHTFFFIHLQEDINYNYSWNASKKTLEFSFSKRSKESKKYTIILDAGHGGKDTGAIGINGIREKDVVFDIVKDLKTILSKNYNVILTRSSDTFIPLYQRPQIGNNANANFFISVHANASRQSTSNGIETFYYSKNSSQYARNIAAYENSVDEKFGIKEKYANLIVDDIFYQMNQEKAAEMASIITKDISSGTGERNRGVFGANFAVLRGSKMPSVLVEVGFLTNSREGRNLASAVYRNKIANSIAEGVNAYFSQEGV